MRRKKMGNERSKRKAGKFAKKISVLSGLGLAFDLNIGTEDFGLSSLKKDRRKEERARRLRWLEAENSEVGNEDASSCL